MARCPDTITVEGLTARDRYGRTSQRDTSCGDGKRAGAELLLQNFNVRSSGQDWDHVAPNLPARARRQRRSDCSRASDSTRVLGAARCQIPIASIAARGSVQQSFCDAARKVAAGVTAREQHRRNLYLERRI